MRDSETLVKLLCIDSRLWCAHVVCNITVAKKEPTLKMILPNLSEYSDRADNDPPVPKRGVSVMQEECIRKRGLTSHPP